MERSGIGCQCGGAPATPKSLGLRMSAADLFTGRGGILPKASETPSSWEEMEIVTWLVIRDPVSRAF